MSEMHQPIPRVVVATTALARGNVGEESAKAVVEELLAAKFTYVRSVVVNRDAQYISELVSHVSNDNEADAIVVVGGTGFGPRDHTCEALDSLFDRRIEGFAEAYRVLLRDIGSGPSSILARAIAGVYNKCLVVALPRSEIPLRRAMRELVVPVLAEAALLACGRPLGQRPPTPAPSGWL